MNDFIDLPHLPECLLGLPLETIHEIHSHTYHAIKADRQQRGEPSLPEGWHIVERRTCYALHQGNEVIALLSGPRAEDNAALLAGLLAQPSAAAPKFG